jgi:hypothetical protein
MVTGLKKLFLFKLWLAITKSGESVNADEAQRIFSGFDHASNSLHEPCLVLQGNNSCKGLFNSNLIAFSEISVHNFFSSLIL